MPNGLEVAYAMHENVDEHHVERRGFKASAKVTSKPWRRDARELRLGFDQSTFLHLGREPVNPEWSADVRFGAHSGLKSDITAFPKSASSPRSRQSQSARTKFAIPFSVLLSIPGYFVPVVA